MTSIFETYAARICRDAKLPAETYDVQELNSIVLSLPLAEAHAALDGIELDALPRLGETLALRDHVQSTFFNVLGDPARPIVEFTKPVLVKRIHLERLEGWRDWRTLAVYLGKEGLEPTMVFRNTPVPIKSGMFETIDHYVADIRIILTRNTKFVWQGTD